MNNKGLGRFGFVILWFVLFILLLPDKMPVLDGVGLVFLTITGVIMYIFGD